MASLSLLLATFFAGLLLAPSSASAYIDPGVGSMALQVLIGGLVGGWITIRLFARGLWRKLRGIEDEPVDDDRND